MAIPIEHLLLSSNRALSWCIYGGPGMNKTLAAHTLPPPIEYHDFEGGSLTLTPWIRSFRHADSRDRIIYPDSVRAAAHARVTTDKHKLYATLAPAPLIDVVSYTNTQHAAFDLFNENIANFNKVNYNSLVIDSIREYSESSKTRARGAGNLDKLMTEVNFSWVAAQERAMTGLRKLRDYRQAGVYLYLVSQADIQKDYIFSPMSKKHKDEEPISVSGSVAVQGQLANQLVHIVDELYHVRMLNGKPTWITEPEALPSGVGYWDAKCRSGAMPKYTSPRFQDAIAALYGRETATAIYTYAYTLLGEQNSKLNFTTAVTPPEPALPQPISDTTLADTSAPTNP